MTLSRKTLCNTIQSKTTESRIPLVTPLNDILSNGAVPGQDSPSEQLHPNKSCFVDIVKNDTEQNDTEKNDTEQNDTEQNDTEQNDAEQNDTEQKEANCDVTEKNDTEQNDSGQNDT